MNASSLARLQSTGCAQARMRLAPHAPPLGPSAAPQVRGELTVEARRKVNTLVITDVHGRDIIDTFVRDSVMDAREFAWESQLRFYWDRNLVSRVEGGRQAAANAAAILRAGNLSAE
jgi:hypothetical protein